VVEGLVAGEIFRPEAAARPLVRNIDLLKLEMEVIRNLRPTGAGMMTLVCKNLQVGEKQFRDCLVALAALALGGRLILDLLIIRLSS